MPEKNSRNKPEQVLHALRKRICLADPETAVPLHEGTLAEEFGLSRTPIRQVLQRLAYERLVEIRSGVGTVASPMETSNRARDFTTHDGIVRTVIALEPLKPSSTEKSEFIATNALVKATETMTPDFVFDMRARLLTVLADLIHDPILKDAFLAAHWRVVRWQMRDVFLNPQGADKGVRHFFQRFAMEKSGDSVFAALLQPVRVPAKAA